jgi:hypothetical protein
MSLKVHRDVTRSPVLHLFRCSQSFSFTTFGLTNAKSVDNKHKHASICDQISSSRLDLCAVVETWHHSNDSPQLMACAQPCAPPGYRYIKKARQQTELAMQSMLTNHGGICFFYKSTFNAREVPLTVYSPCRITQPFAVSADVGVGSTTTASMRTSASLKWFATRRHLVAYLSRSTFTTKPFDHYSTCTLQSDPSVSELHRQHRTAPWNDEDCRREKKDPWLVKRAFDVLAPVLGEFCNASLQSGDLPETQKSALVFPRQKKRSRHWMLRILTRTDQYPT